MRRLRASIGSVLARRRGTAREGSKGQRAWWMLACISTLGLVATFASTSAQKAPDNSSQGLFLVARRDMTDPLFEKSVVLMLPVKGTSLLVGLIVNKPTKMPLHDLFPDSPALPKRDATAYFGGPVEVEARSALFRSSSAPKNSTRVFGDVYVTFDPATIATQVESLQQAPKLRVFVGRAQWAPEQLEDETDEGAWYSLRGDADPIFDPDGESAWRALLGRAEPRPFVERRSPFDLHRSAPAESFGFFLHLPRPITHTVGS